MPEVETSRDGAVLTITLNRPDVLNAFNARDALGAPRRAEGGPRADVRAVVSPAPAAASASGRT